MRLAALGGALPLEARSGLVVFLRRGMWGWIRALAVGSAPQPSLQLPCPRPASALKHRADLLYVFAAMAMNSRGGVHE
ncbi:MAG: hypothetical protein ACMG6H_03005 [Acidobacteriota bacterium]